MFGLWCVRRDFAREHPQETRALYHVLKASRELGRAEADGVIAEAAQVTGLTEATIRDYFPKLAYDLDDRLWNGLTGFLRLLGYRQDCLERYGDNVPHTTGHAAQRGLSLVSGATV